MDPIWMILVSHDDGLTWKLDTPYRLYKSEGRAKDRAEALNRTAVRLRFKAEEYRARQLGREF